MTTMQIASVIAFIAVLAFTYGRPLLSRLPSFSSQPSLMTHVRQVVEIRSTYRTPEVTKACNDLLHVLLGVKP
jgi:hypothetical protein